MKKKENYSILNTLGEIFEGNFNFKLINAQKSTVAVWYKDNPAQIHNNNNNCVRRRRTLPNAVEIDILGIFEGYSSLQIWPPQKIFQGQNYSGRMT